MTTNDGYFSGSHVQRVRVRTVLLAVTVVVAIGGAGLGLLLTSGPSYKHGWCGATLGTIYPNHGGSLLAALAQLRVDQKNGAPVQGFIARENQAYATAQLISADYANVANANVTDIGTEIQVAQTDTSAELTEIGGLRAAGTALATACGAHENSGAVIVPVAPKLPAGA